MIKKIALFLSAFVPMYMLVIIKMLLDLVEGRERGDITTLIVITILLVLVGFGLLGICYTLFNNKTPKTKVCVIKTDNVTGQYFFGYFSLFILVAVHLALYTVSDIVLFFIINIIIAIVYIHNNLYYINPLLNLVGYNVYKVTCNFDGEDKQLNVFIKDSLVKSGQIEIYSTFNYNFCFYKE